MSLLCFDLHPENRSFQNGLESGWVVKSCLRISGLTRKTELLENNVVNVAVLLQS